MIIAFCININSDGILMYFITNYDTIFKYYYFGHYLVTYDADLMADSADDYLNGDHGSADVGHPRWIDDHKKLVVVGG